MFYNERQTAELRAKLQRQDRERPYVASRRTRAPRRILCVISLLAALSCWTWFWDALERWYDPLHGKTTWSSTNAVG